MNLDNIAALSGLENYQRMVAAEAKAYALDSAIDAAVSILMREAQMALEGRDRCQDRGDIWEAFEFETRRRALNLAINTILDQVDNVQP